MTARSKPPLPMAPAAPPAPQEAPDLLSAAGEEDPGAALELLSPPQPLPQHSLKARFARWLRRDASRSDARRPK
jgi:hypothetical protein